VAPDNKQLHFVVSFSQCEHFVWTDGCQTISNVALVLTRNDSSLEESVSAQRCFIYLPSSRKQQKNQRYSDHEGHGTLHRGGLRQATDYCTDLPSGINLACVSTTSILERRIPWGRGAIWMHSKRLAIEREKEGRSTVWRSLTTVIMEQRRVSAGSACVLLCESFSSPHILPSSADRFKLKILYYLNRLINTRTRNKPKTLLQKRLIKRLRMKKLYM
jgi:hypothetical protein